MAALPEEPQQARNLEENVVDDLLPLRSLRQNAYVDMILRLPFLFLLDHILLNDMGWYGFNNLIRNSFQAQSKSSENILFQFASDPNFSTSIEAYLPVIQEEKPWKYIYQGNANHNDTHGIAIFQAAAEIYQSLFYNPNWPALLTGAGYLFILALNSRQLQILYTYMLCAYLILLSQQINDYTITKLTGTEAYISSKPNVVFLNQSNHIIVFNCFAQPVIGFLQLLLLRYQMNNNVNWLKMSPFFNLIPSIFILLGLGLDADVLRNVLPQRFFNIFLGCIAATMTFFSMATTLCICVPKMHRSIKQSFNREYRFIQDFGLSTFLEEQWNRLNVPSLLRTFWLSRCLQQMLASFILFLGATNLASMFIFPTLENSILAIASSAKDLMTRGCETTVAMLGMASIFASISYHFGSMFRAFLTEAGARNIGGMGNDEAEHVGSVSAALFLILALQTGLTSLEPDKRFARLCKNLCLLVTALFHFVHNMASPVLMSLSAARVINYRRHLRALSICLFLVLAPVILMAVLWKLFPVGTWLLAVSAFCVEVVVKVLVTVTIYGLFLYDSKARDGTWEHLDDAVYYVRSLGNTVEFCFAVFLFFNGGWILLFESGGTIRALMMLIHAYCNIWCEAKSGWATFVKRRSAVQKINALPDATPEQLAANDDVCAICYQDMELVGSAKVTKCKHFFHGKCLRKWLYVQDSCPLCYGALYEDKDKKESKVPTQADRAQVADANEVQDGLIDHDHAMERPIDDSDENDSSSSTDENIGECSITQNTYDIDELAEDTESSSSDSESNDNEGSWSCSEEDDLLYDSMDDCKRNIHSEEIAVSLTAISCPEVHTDNRSLNKQTYPHQKGLCAHKTITYTSHLSETSQTEEPVIESEQSKHIFPDSCTSSNKHNDSSQDVNHINSNS